MLEREILNTLKTKLVENKIVILLGSIENTNEENLITELNFTENFKIVDIADKKTKKQFQKIKQEEFESLTSSLSSLVIKDAQNLDNLQNIIDYVLLKNSSLNLVCLCSSIPLLNEVLLKALESEGLIIKTTSPTFKEIAKHFGLMEIEKNLEKRLIFGNHEKVFNSEDEAISFLNECITNILRTTLNAKERINKVENLRLLLQQIALNIGNHVSYNDLGLKSNLDNETVERYVNMLEKSQVIIKLPVFSTDQKYELKKTHCLYFYDNGIRNAFIKNFNALEFRNDTNELWKNWFITEKIKKAILNHSDTQFYFWVTHTKQKVDFIEISSNQQIAYQMKWNKKEKNKFPKNFIETYSKMILKEVNRSTYWSFLAKD
jgi:predicted AAA+ superfamily ATPase